MQQTGILAHTLPVLETQRLLLRAHRPADLSAMSAMWADPAVVRFLGSTPQNSQDTWMRFLRYAGHWAALGFGYWALEEKATGRFVGEAGFADYHRLTEPPIELAPEIGWVLATEAHGRGLATEAAQALVQWGEQHFDPAHPMCCLIEQGHHASRHVAEKCGFTLHTTIQYRGAPAWVLQRPLPAP